MSQIELPSPRCTYADHSYPAYSKRQMIDFAEASRRAALEEAAKICGEKAVEYERDFEPASSRAAELCADAIRALAKEATDETSSI